MDFDLVISYEICRHIIFFYLTLEKIFRNFPEFFLMITIGYLYSVQHLGFAHVDMSTGRR